MYTQMNTICKPKRFRLFALIINCHVSKKGPLENGALIFRYGFHFFYYCAVLWCVQIIKYIMAWLSYSFARTLHYLIIIIMQTYLKVLDF